MCQTWNRGELNAMNFIRIFRIFVLTQFPSLFCLVFFFEGAQQNYTRNTYTIVCTSTCLDAPVQLLEHCDTVIWSISAIRCVSCMECICKRRHCRMNSNKTIWHGLFCALISLDLWKHTKIYLFTIVHYIDRLLA